MTVFDATCVAVNVRNAGAALEGDHASGVGVLNVADVYDFPATGQVSINGDVYDYTAVDDETDTVTLSGVTTAAYDDGTPVWVDPLAPVRYATVMIGSDQGSQNALVPHHLVALLDEQMQDTPDGFPVRVEPVSAGRMGWQVVEVPGQSATHNASTVPIVVTTEFGESVRIDGDGVTTYTNDPVPIRTIPGSVKTVAAADGYVYTATTTQIRKFDEATGIENLSGFPITSTFNNWPEISVESGFLYIQDSAADVRKYNATTGAQVLTGFPIVGTFVDVAVRDGFLYLVDFTNGDIRKFNAGTGAEVLTGFPIVGTFAACDAADGFVFAVDSAGDVRKFDATTGAEDTSGFPIVAGADGFCIQADGGHVYVRITGSGPLRKYDATTGVEDTSGFPLDVGPEIFCVRDGRLYLVVDLNAVRILNAANNYPSVVVDSSDGSVVAHPMRASEVTVSGDITLRNISLAGPEFTNVTYNGSWTDFGSPYEDVSYRLLADGTVQLRGLAKHATTTTIGTIFTLPVGYRPAKQRHYKLDAGPGWAIVTIATTGVVSIASYVSSGSAANVSFDGVTFDTAA